jgi:putative transcriptional regulator
MIMAEAILERMGLMDSALRARFERLGPIRGIDRVSSGSPGAFVLRVPQLSGKVRSIDAMFSLARHGMTMLRAKRAVDMLLETGRVFVDLPTVESVDRVVRELAEAGIAAAEFVAGPPVDAAELGDGAAGDGCGGAETPEGLG